MDRINLNTTLSFANLVQNDLLDVEYKLRNYVKADFPSLGSALDMIFSGGGKRIRPTMILLLGKMINAPRAKLLILATAIEMLHTATLVHDDLIDNAVLRRGNPTINTQWTPSATVLTGDLLFASSARLAAEMENIEAMKLFSQTLIEIVNGELNQMFAGRCQISREEYYKRIYAKTSSMFQAGAKSTALITSPDMAIANALSIYGHDIGIAFQIIDDILDFTGEQATVGKPVASDLRQGLITLPAIIFIEDHPEHKDIKNLQEGKCLENDESIDRLVADIRASDAISKAHRQAREFIASGIQALDQFSITPERMALEELACFIVNRDL
jgi:geranylgeranyl pyrophosphate synthase